MKMINGTVPLINDDGGGAGQPHVLQMNDENEKK